LRTNYFFILNLISLTFFTVYTQAEDIDWSKAFHKTDEVFSDLNSEHGPGCAIGVIHQGSYVFNKGYGMANLEQNIPIDSKTTFRIASLSKQFTAAAIAILSERGEIDIDADIHNYLPDLMRYRTKVTIRQIIHHISGIPDYEEYGSPFLDATKKDFIFGNTDYYSVNEFYDLVKTLPLESEPEEKFSYSNTGYFLLSQVIEHVTGVSLRKFTEKTIFQPLDMRQTFYMDNVNSVVPNRADGYKYLDDGSLEIFMTNLNWTGDGAVHTSLDDFIMWDRNFYDNKLAGKGPEFIKTLETPHPFFKNLPSADTFATGVFSPYAWGMLIMEHRGLKAIGHTGGWVGYRAYYLRYPELRLSFITMCNANKRSRTARRINAIRDSYLDAVNAVTE
jgi:CubicO group peptidase (beta-lactamase class C family)